MCLSDFAICPMQLSDLSAGLRLSSDAGWNQTLVDWRRQFELEPDGCFVAVNDFSAESKLDKATVLQHKDRRQVIGTVATCRFGDVGWVSMMLVDSGFRSRGVGRALMEHALEYLDSRGCRSVRLDATQFGAPLYRSLGFEPQFELVRYHGTVCQSDASPKKATVVRPPDLELETLLRLDRAVVWYDRTKLLRRLLSTDRACGWQTEDASAACLTRPGRLATFVGPVLAESFTTGHQLIRQALSCLGGQPVYLDAPRDDVTTGELAGRFGLKRTRTLMRMARGSRLQEKLSSTASESAFLLCSTGPENG